jgi:hypothetical protein
MGTQAQPKPTPGQPPAKTNAAPSSTSAIMEKARSGKKKAPENETPEQTFKRLIEPRVTKLLKGYKQVRNLARFKPTEDQRKKIFGALSEAHSMTVKAFESTAPITEQGFQL